MVATRSGREMSSITDDKRKSKTAKTAITNTMPPPALKECHRILSLLKAQSEYYVFGKPVNAAQLGLEDYHDVVTHPMDLGTVAENLKLGRYPTLEAFKSDVRLTFENAMTYNEHDTVVHNIAKGFLSLLGMDNEEVQGSVPKVATQRPESSIPSINNDLMEKQEHEPMVSTHSFDTSSNEPLGMTVDFGETCVIVKAVAKGSLAESLGIQVYDEITHISGKTDFDDRSLIVDQLKRRPLTLEVRRPLLKLNAPMSTKEMLNVAIDSSSPSGQEAQLYDEQSGKTGSPDANLKHPPELNVAIAFLPTQSSSYFKMLGD